MKTLSQTALAEALGVAKSLITKLKARGMPVHSVEAAQAWREANLCFDSRRRELDPRRPWPNPSPVEYVDRVHAMIPAALAALRAGRFVDVELELRQALCDVPDSHSDQLKLPFAVFDALTEDVLRLLEESDPSDGPLTEAEVQKMGNFWLDVARGLVQVVDRRLSAG